MPAYLKYVTGSVNLQGNIKTEAAGDDEVTYNGTSHTMTINVGNGSAASAGGTVTANGTAHYNYSYKVTISDNCADMGMTPVRLLQSSSLFYSGFRQVWGIHGFKAFKQNGCTNPVGPTIAILHAGCEIVLPVKLVTFTAVASTIGNVINWKGEEHYDVKKYTLQFSHDGVVF